MMQWNAFIRCCVLTLALASIGCQGEDAVEPVVPDPAKVYAKLQLNYEAIMLTKTEPYDTIRLHAVPLSLSGDTLSTDNPVIYFRQAVRDTSIAVDSFSGFVRVRSSIGSASVRVIARLAIGTDTLADTAEIMVRNDLVLRRVSRIALLPGLYDSSVRWAGNTSEVSYRNWVRIFDTNNDTIPTSASVFNTRVQKPEVVNPFAFEYTGVRGLSGESYIYARVYAYGEEFRDSILFRRIDPPVRLVKVDMTIPTEGEPALLLRPAVITAKAGTTVYFFNTFNLTVGTTLHQTDDFFCQFFPPETCGVSNRYRYSRPFPESGTQLIWTDSVDIVFDQPSMASVGDNYPYIELGTIRAGDLPSDFGSGDIPAFSIQYCKFVADVGSFDGCGMGLFVFDGFPAIVDNGIRARKFAVPGTYHYSSTRYPHLQGTIIITP